jgi:hypothetical protein
MSAIPRQAKRMPAGVPMTRPATCWERIDEQKIDS